MGRKRRKSVSEYIEKALLWLFCILFIAFTGLTVIENRSIENVTEKKIKLLTGRQDYLFLKGISPDLARDPELLKVIREGKGRFFFYNMSGKRKYAEDVLFPAYIEELSVNNIDPAYTVRQLKEITEYFLEKKHPGIKMNTKEFYALLDKTAAPGNYLREKVSKEDSKFPAAFFYMDLLNMNDISYDDNTRVYDLAKTIFMKEQLKKDAAELIEGLLNQ